MNEWEKVPPPDLTRHWHICLHSDVAPVVQVRDGRWFWIFIAHSTKTFALWSLDCDCNRDNGDCSCRKRCGCRWQPRNEEGRQVDAWCNENGWKGKMKWDRPEQCGNGIDRFGQSCGEETGWIRNRDGTPPESWCQEGLEIVRFHPDTPTFPRPEVGQ